MKIYRLLLLMVIFISCRSVGQNIPAWKATTLKDYITKSDSVLVVNFWATFCKPCIEEIPYFQTTIDKLKDKRVKLLLVSLDLKDEYPAKIRSFAMENRYNAQIVWLNETNADYFCPIIDKAWMGGIPSTLIINPKTGYRKFFESPLKQEELEKEISFAVGN